MVCGKKDRPDERFGAAPSPLEVYIVSGYFTSEFLQRSGTQLHQLLDASAFISIYNIYLIANKTSLATPITL